MRYNSGENNIDLSPWLGSFFSTAIHIIIYYRCLLSLFYFFLQGEHCHKYEKANLYFWLSPLTWFPYFPLQYNIIINIFLVFYLWKKCILDDFLLEKIGKFWQIPSRASLELDLKSSCNFCFTFLHGGTFSQVQSAYIFENLCLMN